MDNRIAPKFFVLPALLFALLPAAYPSDSPRFDGWKQASTDHFRFIYEEESLSQLRDLAAAADGIWEKTARAYSPPPEKTDVLITARTDTVNAFAEGTRHFMGVYANSPLSPEFGFRADWAELVFTHELVHIANFKFQGKQNTAARLFGPFMNVFDIISIPGWMIEGITTVLETELTQGGRGRSPFFELYFKAPTLENDFLDLAEIGKETEPPRGQIYVYGYILARSIADRWGLSALAKIEEVRRSGKSFSESVKEVTGETPERIFRDARIALAKNYSGERTIPEGNIVTPTNKNDYYHMPAAVKKDGIILLRSSEKKDFAAVRWDPAKKEETVLFEAPFADSASLAACDGDLVVAALRTNRFDAMPGLQVSTDLWTWTEKTGLVQLTRGGSLFQPALSRDGKKLVAVEQTGFRYRLTEVSLEDGSRKVLVELPGQSCIQPALSPDGGKLAFLILDGTRARVAAVDMPRYEFAYPVSAATIAAVDNDSGPIIDVAWPHWQADGDLTWASNRRGRLEVWESSKKTNRPCVADPIGAFWAEKTESGVLYASYSASGDILKILPGESWGTVPDFEGPSLPGRIMTFGGLVSDFPAFDAFPAPETESGEKTAGAKIEPHFIDESGDAGQSRYASAFPDAQKAFINLPKPFLWLPDFSYTTLPEDESAWGGGGFVLLTGYPMQAASRTPIIAAGAVYFPGVGQVQADLMALLPVYTGTLIGIAGHGFGSIDDDGTERFYDGNALTLSYSLPVASIQRGRDIIDLAAVCGFEAALVRYSDEAFSLNEGPSGSSGFTGRLGLDLFREASPLEAAQTTLRASGWIMATGYADMPGRTFISAELDGSGAWGSRTVQAEAGIRTAWFDLPEDHPVPATLAQPGASETGTTYPGRMIFRTAVVFPGMVKTRVYGEKLLQFGKNSAGIDTPDRGTFLNLGFSPEWHLGAEADFEAGRTRMAVGAASELDFESGEGRFSSLSFYITCKLDALLMKSGL